MDCTQARELGQHLAQQGEPLTDQGFADPVVHDCYISGYMKIAGSNPGWDVPDQVLLNGGLVVVALLGMLVVLDRIANRKQ